LGSRKPLGRRKSVSLGMREKWGKSPGSMALAGGGVCCEHMVQVEFSDVLKLLF